MATWDVFHGDRLEVERSLATSAVREAWARGELRDDDLIRPAGTTIPWARLADFPALLEPDPGPSRMPEPGGDREEGGDASDEPGFPDERDEGEADDQTLDANVLEDGVEEQVAGDEGFGADDLELADDESLIALPVGGTGDEAGAAYDPQDEDEEAAEFTLSRNSPEKVEELDLAAMVDVAFQLVLFFLVTATTVLYKSLEVPKPNPDSPAAAAAQGRSRTLDDLKDDYILVEIDPAGALRIDREPVAAEMSALVERLRVAREKTGRRAMLLSADFATPHRNAVLAYDAANEIGLGIAIARPQAPAGGPRPPKKAPEG